MYRQFIILLFLFFSINGFSQADSEEEDYVNDNVLKYDDYNYKSNIKTVKIHESTWEYASPLINLNSNEQIELSFDDIEGDQKQYSLTFVHCNADWTPSDLMISEYLSGFFDLNFINFTFSMNTLQKYTHYTILFPQQNLKFTKSGNYIVYVYSNGDKKDLVLSRRIMVYDDKVTLASTFRQSTGDEQFNKQHIDFTIYNSGYDITNPYTDLKVVLTQNNRWDNAVTNIKPTFMGGNQ
ncbi:MAG: type IX secretion system plug protein, partial [Bacteroidia bacterium]